MASLLIIFILIQTLVFKLVKSDFPPTIVVGGIVRDFSAFSPNFEDYGLGTYDTYGGVMENQLNSKDRPSVIPSSFRSAAPYWHGKLFTEEQVADIPGVNIRYEV